MSDRAEGLPGVWSSHAATELSEPMKSGPPACSKDTFANGGVMGNIGRGCSIAVWLHCWVRTDVAGNYSSIILKDNCVLRFLRLLSALFLNWFGCIGFTGSLLFRICVWLQLQKAPWGQTVPKTAPVGLSWRSPACSWDGLESWGWPQGKSGPGLNFCSFLCRGIVLGVWESSHRFELFAFECKNKVRFFSLENVSSATLFSYCRTLTKWLCWVCLGILKLGTDSESWHIKRR